MAQGEGRGARKSCHQSSLNSASHGFPKTPLLPTGRSFWHFIGRMSHSCRTVTPQPVEAGHPCPIRTWSIPSGFATFRMASDDESLLVTFDSVS